MQHNSRNGIISLLATLYKVLPKGSITNVRSLHKIDSIGFIYKHTTFLNFHFEIFQTYETEKNSTTYTCAIFPVIYQLLTFYQFLYLYYLGNFLNVVIY
jgi:hypothetical protein